MKEKNISKIWIIKAVSIVYMSILTVFISYNISKIFQEVLWENERTSVTILISLAFLVSLIYFVKTEKDILVMMIVYHFVLLGTLVCTVIPVQFMPFMIIPMVVTAVYDLKGGFVVNTTIASVMLMGFWDYPLYIFGAALPVIGMASCFAVWNSNKLIKNICGSVIYIVVEIVAIWGFQYFCEGSDLEYESFGFMALMVILGIVYMVISNILGIAINWLYRKKTPAFYLKKICDDNFVAIRLMKNKSTSLYYHSTEVAELARVAATRIGADDELAYAGGLYHDLGKIAGSEYIKEGLALADKYGIPKSVKSIMVEHNVKSRLPKTKEAAIVMLCDTAVSAVEYLKGTMDKKDMSEKTIMENALNKRIISGTLHRSGLTIEEFDMIKEVLIKIKEHQ